MKMPTEVQIAAPSSGLERAFALINSVAMVISTVALLAAAIILTESVVVRYFLKQTTDWQDEYSVMLLVAATFKGGCQFDFSGLTACPRCCHAR